jgi:hypothetical protein
MLTARLRFAVLLAGVFLAALFLYAFLHEAGHALAAVLSGATLTAFDLSPFGGGPHVSYFGGLTPAQTLLNNLAGVSLPLLVWLGFMLAVPRRANLVLEVLKLFATVIGLNTLLAWIILPILYLAGRAPGDDAINFLNNSGAHPLWVSAAALLVYLAGWALFFRKIEPPKLLLARISPTSLWPSPAPLDRAGLVSPIPRSPMQATGDGGQALPTYLTPSDRRAALALAGLVVLCAVAALALNSVASTAPDPFAPPPSYQPVAQLDVGARPYESEVLYAFHLDRAQPAGLYLLISDMSADYFDLTLAGPGDERRVVLHGEGYAPSRDSVRLEETFPPGDYQLLLTVRASRGGLSLYVMGLP